MKSSNRSFGICLILFLNVCPLAGQVVESEPSGTKKILRAIADAVLRDSAFQFTDKESGKTYTAIECAPSNAHLVPSSRYNDWRYWNGVINIALLKLSEVLSDSTFSEYAKKNIAFGFEAYPYFEKKYNGEGKWNYPFGERFITEELDDCGAMGASVIQVYRTDDQERYRTYIDQAADHILNKQTRLEDGTFVRGFPRKWTLWADDLYMGIVFLSRMGELTKDNRYFDDAAHQVIQFHKYLFDEQKGAMHHNWYSDIRQTGIALWGRANGWAILAQVDLLDRLPKNHPQYDTLLKLFRTHIYGIVRLQGKDGLWHQLLDKTDSYLETSCSAMFTYAIARAVNKGYIASSYELTARRGWEGIKKRIRADGQIEGICTGTIVSDELTYYYQRPTPLNDVHGIGTIILAGTEILLLP